MKLFAGLSRTDYEDVFRALGALVDERGWTNVSLLEVDEGIVVQVMVKPTCRDHKPHLETYLLTDSDLERVMRDAVARRRKKDNAPRAVFAPPAVETPPPPPPIAFPAPSQYVEDRLAARYANTPPAIASMIADEAPLPPMPALDGLPGERPLGGGETIDELPIVTQTTVLPVEEEEPLFAPEPMRLSIAPAPPAYDQGAARAAVVMAHIVAARLKSGMPMTGDDPDLASLLEQVRALDETGIGRG